MTATEDTPGPQISLSELRRLAAAIVGDRPDGDGALLQGGIEQLAADLVIALAVCDALEIDPGYRKARPIVTAIRSRLHPPPPPGYPSDPAHALSAFRPAPREDT